MMQSISFYWRHLNQPFTSLSCVNSKSDCTSNSKKAIDK